MLFISGSSLSAALDGRIDETILHSAALIAALRARPHSTSAERDSLGREWIYLGLAFLAQTHEDSIKNAIEAFTEAINVLSDERARANQSTAAEARIHLG